MSSTTYHLRSATVPEAFARDPSRSWEEIERDLLGGQKLQDGEAVSCHLSSAHLISCRTPNLHLSSSHLISCHGIGDESATADAAAGPLLLRGPPGADRPPGPRGHVPAHDGGPRRRHQEDTAGGGLLDERLHERVRRERRLVRSARILPPARPPGWAAAGRARRRPRSGTRTGPRAGGTCFSSSRGGALGQRKGKCS